VKQSRSTGLIGRLLLHGAFLVAIAIVAVGACSPGQVVLPAPSPTVPAASPALTLSPSPTRAPTTPPATPSPSPSAPASPGSSPAPACPALIGGSTANQVQLTAIRIAHNSGFDRLVFEFGPSTAPGAYGMPPYQVAVATSLGGPSGQPISIAGSALFSVRFQNASTVQPDGTTRTYTGATSIKPTTPLIREVRLVEDFERVLVWGVGLDKLACPQTLVLSSPVRLVLDFPTPP